MKRSILKECLRIAVRKNDTHPEYGNYQHFAFVIQSNKIVEWATNMPGPAEAVFGFSPTRHKIHAESAAYKRARGILDKADRFEVVNVRLNRRNETRISAPCACCSRLLQAVGCSKIWFTTDVGWATLAA